MKKVKKKYIFFLFHFFGNTLVPRAFEFLIAIPLSAASTKKRMRNVTIVTMETGRDQNGGHGGQTPVTSYQNFFLFFRWKCLQQLQRSQSE